MTKKLKMSLLGMSSVAVMAAPVALAVSCGSGEFVESSIDGKNDGEWNFEPFPSRDNVGNGEVLSNGTNYKAKLVLDGDNHTENDHAFNQAAYESIKSIPQGGIHNADNSVVINADTSVSKPTAPNGTEQFVNAYTATSDNTIMVLAGFMHIDPLAEYFKSTSTDANTKNKYAILLDGDFENERVASVNFQSYQAAFEAGVLAGYYLNTNKERFGKDLKVATFGGMNIPTVVGSMTGFQKGVEWFNSNNDSFDEKYRQDIIFIDNGNEADYISGGFAPGGGRSIADKLVSGGADLIYPVAGAQTNDVLQSIKSKRSPAQIIGVDSAQELDPTFGNYVAFSALKDLKTATTKVMEVISGSKNSSQPGYNGIKGLGGQTLGDLDNGLVGLSKPNWVSEEIYNLATSGEVKTAAMSLNSDSKFKW